VTIGLPAGNYLSLGVCGSWLRPEMVAAGVRKDAGDDPDVTHGVEVWASVCWQETPEISLVAGSGVGTVTKVGLALAPGEPAINPVPRQMIHQAVREVTARGVRIVFSIPGGEDLAARTFNPRLGIVGGLSILGTSGRVRPYCLEALAQAISLAVDVAEAAGKQPLVLVPGHLGAQAAKRTFRFAEEQLIEVGNSWGVALERIAQGKTLALLALGHPGKLGKLAAGHWDTHSARSPSPLPWLRQLAMSQLGAAPPETPTVEGLFAQLPLAVRSVVAEQAACVVRAALEKKLGRALDVTVVLTDVRGQWLGAHGPLAARPPLHGVQG
jgi:cobalt-precorrin-5B (C1)-methyltransferase